MNSTPLFTIVTVTYNAQEHLKQTIQSIINQNYKNIEFLIIDGGSQDNTVSIIKEYEEHITYWHSKKDHGIFDAMNIATSIAKGDWINFLNAGDSFVSKDTLSKVAESINFDIDVAVGHKYDVFENAEPLFLRANGIESIKSHGIPGCHQSMFIKSSIMKKYQYNLFYKYAADHELMLRLYEDNKQFQILDFPIANYLKDGMSEENRLEAWLEILFMLYKFNPSNSHTKDFVFYQQFLDYANTMQNDQYKLLNFSKEYNKIYDQMTDYIESFDKIVLYGNGKIAKMLLNRDKHNVCAILDKNVNTTPYKNVPIYEPHKLDNIDYDMVLITVLGREDIIIKDLLSMTNIAKNDIKVFSLD